MSLQPPRGLRGRVGTESKLSMEKADDRVGAALLSVAKPDIKKANWNLLCPPPGTFFLKLVCVYSSPAYLATLCQTSLSGPLLFHTESSTAVPSLHWS